MEHLGYRMLRCVTQRVASSRTTNECTFVNECGGSVVVENFGILARGQLSMQFYHTRHSAGMSYVATSIHKLRAKRAARCGGLAGIDNV